MRKAFALMLVLMLSFTSVVSANDAYSDYNLELSIQSGTDVVQSGKQTYLNIGLKATGSQTTFTNVILKLKPTHLDLLEFDKGSLDQLIPRLFDSYTIEDGTLSFYAKTLDSGLFYEFPIRVASKNGLSPNGSSVAFEMTFESTELVKTPILSEPILIEASSPLKVNKQYSGMVVDNTNQTGKIWGTQSYWTTKAIIDGQKTGQEYILEGTHITIVETYHPNLKYVGMKQGQEPVVDTNLRTLTWVFDAPSYQEQEAFMDSLFSEDLVVIYTTQLNEGEEPTNKKVDVQVAMSFTSVSGDVHHDESGVSVTLYKEVPLIPELHGTWNVFGHWGPTNGDGGFGTGGNDLDPRPTVYPQDTLTFAHRLSAMYIGRFPGFEELIFNYIIDDYLDLKTLKLPSQWVYFPENYAGVVIPPLAENPEYDIYLLRSKPELDIKGDNDLLDEDVIAVLRYGIDFQHGDEISIKDMLASKGLDPNQHVAQVRYHFDGAPAGLFNLTGVGGSNMFRYEFDINPQWRESQRYDLGTDMTSMENEITIYMSPRKDTPIFLENITAEVYDYREATINGTNACSTNQPSGSGSWVDNNGILISCMYQRYNALSKEVRPNGFGQSAHWGVNGPRSAYVTADPIALNPTVSNTIDLVDNTKGEIFEGPNQIEVTVSNNLSSVGTIKKGGFDSYLLIPNSITLDLDSAKAVNQLGEAVSFDLIDTGLTQSHYSIYKIQWAYDSAFDMKANTHLALVVDVNVLDTYRDITMHILTDLFNNDDFDVLVSSEPKITDTTKVRDTLGLTDEEADYELMKSSNQYLMISDYFVETEKWVKGSLDTTFNKSGLSDIDGLVEYELQFTNKEGRALNSFVLMDVLPSLDDLGISDNLERGSQFNLSLKQAVVMDDRFTVYYSESKNPSRDVLNDVLDKDGFDLLSNPLNVDEKPWLLEDEVEHWDSIFSFIIMMNEGAVIEEGEITSVQFVTHIPVNQRDALRDNEADLIAWNSFALAIDGKPTVEPLRVPVTIEGVKPVDPEVPETPEVPEIPEVPVLPPTGVQAGSTVLAVLFIFLGMVITKRKALLRKKQ